MDILFQLNNYYTKQNSKDIGLFAIQNKQIKYLIDLSISATYPTNARSSWALSTTIEIDKKVLKPYIDLLCNKLKILPNKSVERNYLKIISNYPIKESLQGLVTTHCFQVINDTNKPIANKIYAIDTIETLCKQHPDLYQELYYSVQVHINNSSAGFKSRAKKIIRKYEALN